MMGNMVNPFDVANRVAVVTGGGRGIGVAIAEALAEAGANVVIASRSADTCEQTAASIRANGGRAIAVVTDVTDPDSRAALVLATVEEFGGIDILVNNAAILRPHVTTRVSEAEFDEIFATNVKGPVFLSAEALPHLAEGGGSIINISALGAFQPMVGIGAYCAAKAAMANWTQTMAKEWASSKVRVNMLVPGPVATEMILPRDPAEREAFVTSMAAETLMGRIAEPTDLVGAVVFLASDASAFMTGRSVFLDGGMLQ
jgi:NAD(P)-dependent dehydrogenase (short-subunit alcohol dehydrogenase family)